MDERSPHDHFEFLLKEMKKIERQLEQVHQRETVGKGIHQYETNRALYEARACLEVAQYWIGKALAAADTADDDD